MTIVWFLSVAIFGRTLLSFVHPTDRSINNVNAAKFLYSIIIYTVPKGVLEKSIALIKKKKN